MKQYAYRARTSAGKLQKGNLSGNDSAAIARTLREQGLTPIGITPLKEKTLSVTFALPKRSAELKHEELIPFCRQLSALIKAGIPILDALKRQQQTLRSKKMQQGLQKVCLRLEQGAPLSLAFEAADGLFSKLFCQMVAVGETSGRLPESFASLSAHYAFSLETSRRLRSVMRYPLIVIGAIFIGTLILGLFVIPAFANAYQSMGHELPLLTRALIGFSNLLVHHGIFLSLGFALLTTALLTMLQTDSYRERWDRCKLRIPLLGGIILRLLFARFARSFAMLYRSAISMVDGLSLSAEFICNQYLSERMLEMRTSILQGESLLQVASETKLFSPLVLQMIQVGEETGELDSMLDQVADFYEAEVGFEIKRLNDYLEPLLLVIVGGMVLVLALGVLLPMWNMTAWTAGG